MGTVFTLVIIGIAGVVLLQASVAGRGEETLLIIAAAVGLYFYKNASNQNVVYSS